MEHIQNNNHKHNALRKLSDSVNWLWTVLTWLGRKGAGVPGESSVILPMSNSSLIDHYF